MNDLKNMDFNEVSDMHDFLDVLEDAVARANRPDQS